MYASWLRISKGLLYSTHNCRKNYLNDESLLYKTMVVQKYLRWKNSRKKNKQGGGQNLLKNGFAFKKKTNKKINIKIDFNLFFFLFPCWGSFLFFKYIANTCYMGGRGRSTERLTKRGGQKMVIVFPKGFFPFFFLKLLKKKIAICFF